MCLQKILQESSVFLFRYSSLQSSSVYFLPLFSLLSSIHSYRYCRFFVLHIYHFLVHKLRQSWQATFLLSSLHKWSVIHKCKFKRVKCNFGVDIKTIQTTTFSFLLRCIVLVFIYRGVQIDMTEICRYSKRVTVSSDIYGGYFFMSLSPTLLQGFVIQAICDSRAKC